MSKPFDLKKLEAYLADRTAHFIGYPVNLTYNYDHLKSLLLFAMNNIGDPFLDSNYQITTRHIERKVIHFFSKLYKMKAEDSWGYVTSGGTEGNLFSLFLAREIYPNGILYFSSETHYSIKKCVRLLKIAHEVIPAQSNGEIDYDILNQKLELHKDHPAIINANIGTTMRGAIDRISIIKELIDGHGIREHYIHADAALFGMLVPFLKGAPRLDFQNHISSISISGHKFVGAPLPCGVVLAKKHNVHKIESEVEYIGTLDSTISGSRSGHGPLFMYEAIKQNGLREFGKQARACVKNAEYLYQKLCDHNYPAFLNPFSNIVVIKRPSKKLEKKWQLACEGDFAHVVVMQQVGKKKIDQFLTDLLYNKSPSECID